MALPILITAPRYISGIITLGALMQSVQAFQQMAAALSWPANNMPIIAQWHASVDRVLGLVEALNDLEQESSCSDSA
jgi:putative ATP-binding cassette transporter